MAWLYARSNGSLKLTLFYHYTITASAILKGAFLTTDALPKSDVLESAISVLLFTAWALFLYRIDRMAKSDGRGGPAAPTTGDAGHTETGRDLVK